MEEKNNMKKINSQEEQNSNTKQEINRNNEDKGKKQTKKKPETYSSSGSDSQEKFKSGVINCLCRYQTYEPDMLKCQECREFAHAICYGKKVTENFKCAVCSFKKGEITGNKEIDEYYSKPRRTYKEKQEFVFKLNTRRVLKSILNQEFLCCQPGIEPSPEFLKIRFGFSSSYSAKITVKLIKEGLINVYGGFSFDGGRIIDSLGLHQDLDEPEIEEIQREKETVGFDIGGDFNQESKPKKDENKKQRKRPREGSPTGDESNKKSRENSTTGEKEKVINSQETENNTSKDAVSDISSREASEERNGQEKEYQNRKTENYFSSSSSSSCYSPPEPKAKDKPIESNINNSDPDSMLGDKITRDRNGRKYKIMLSWPVRFTNSESRNISKDIPESVALLGKRTKRPVYGQVVDINEPRQNNDPKKWNLHFILGMEGELVQCWVFGTEEEIREIAKKLQPEEYYLFWGDFKIKEKYSSKFKYTNDWAIYLSSSCNKFDKIRRSRQYLDSEDSKSEDLEKFADKFQTAPRKGSKILKKKKEHNARMKGKLDHTQKKITEYGIIANKSANESSTSNEEDALLINVSDGEKVNSS